RGVALLYKGHRTVTLGPPMLIRHRRTESIVDLHNGSGTAIVERRGSGANHWHLVNPRTGESHSESLLLTDVRLIHVEHDDPVIPIECNRNLISRQRSEKVTGSEHRDTD